MVWVRRKGVTKSLTIFVERRVNRISIEIFLFS
jgi:hypothetical protein